MNPYEAPQSESLLSERADYSPDQSPWRMIHQVFRAWEQRRLLYNVVLVIWTIACTLCLGGIQTVADTRFWILTTACAVIANGAYFLGPIVEAYTTWIRSRRQEWRGMLFWLGTVLTMLFALLWSLIMSKPIPFLM